MTTAQETPEERLARYEAGAVRDPNSTDERGKFWWALLNAEPEGRLRTVARCAEEGWIGPNNVRYLATVLQLPETAGWDDITAKVRALMAAQHG